MSMKYVTSSASQRWDGSANYLNYNITTSGKNRLLVVSITINGTSDLVTGVTYGGVAMSQARTAINSAASPSETGYLYTLVNPALGTNAIVILCSGNAYIGSSAAAYSGVKQTLTIDDTQSRDTSGSFNVTTTTPYDWIIATGHGPDSGYFSQLTQRGGAESNTISDSTKNVTKGVNTLTLTSGGSRNATGIAIAIKGIPDLGAAFLNNFL